MSSLKFDGHQHRVHLLDKAGHVLGSWTAYNNIDSQFAAAHYHSLRHLENGLYPVQDPVKPHFHQADANGAYGLHGIIRFKYPGHSGVGLHAGRANDVVAPGARHATHGCIRTTDAAMAIIRDIMKNDHLTTIGIVGNNEVSVQHGHHRSIHGHPTSEGGVRG